MVTEKRRIKILVFPAFNIFSGRGCAADLAPGIIDCHCHILPGVDDGIRSLEDSLAVLKEYERIGIEEVWLTPHIMEDMPNTPGRLRSVFETLAASYRGPLQLRLASENMMDNLLTKNLAERTLLPIGSSADRLLIETSYYDRPVNFYDTIETILSMGLQPVLAHPERYIYLGEKEYATLRSLGILFQLNLFSLAGIYGPMTKNKAEMLTDRRMYDFIGTDLHSARQTPLLLKPVIPRKYLRYLSEISHNRV